MSNSSNELKKLSNSNWVQYMLSPCFLRDSTGEKCSVNITAKVKNEVDIQQGSRPIFQIRSDKIVRSQVLKQETATILPLL